MTDPVEDAEDIADANAAEPASMSADGVTVTNRSLKETDDHVDRVRNREAGRNGNLGVRFFNTKPPGAT